MTYGTLSKSPHTLQKRLAIEANAGYLTSKWIPA